jgi:pimeloyl-ACP methyl ester carboxylesterase
MRPLAAVALCLLTAACRPAVQPTALDRLHPCAFDEGPTDAYCGAVRVFEDRAARQGRTIDLRVIVLPALGTEARPDPVVLLAGGPGQGAAEMARQLRDLFRGVQRTRDIVLVDQRGTGKSNPLNCRDESDSLRVLSEPEETSLRRLRDCLERYDADPRLYTTSIAMDDLDEVRATLGYERVNLLGVSYGTRAALEYVRRHGDRVRTVTLDSVAPPEMRLPLFAARDAQRALDAMVKDCEADASCRARYPDLGARLRALVARLEAQPVRTTLVHPRTGVAEEVDVNARLLVSTLFGALYSPVAASLIPALVERAERNDFQAFLALAMVNEAGADNMSVGMQLSVLCAEDAPRTDPAEAARLGGGTVFGTHLMALIRACSFWPRGTVDERFYTPVASPAPTLILSGALDPVTPPSWVASVTARLPNARHIVAPGTGHGVVGVGCAMRVVERFIDTADARGVDARCLDVLKRPPFFLTPAGPDPRVGASAADGS